jgi:hypothetical protein
MELCANCGEKIGKLETPFLWRDNVVCRRCYDRVRDDLATPPPIPVARVIAPPPPPTPESSEEKVYFHSADVYVSRSRCILGGKTYAMSNMTSVELAKMPAARGAGISLAGFGGLLLLIGVSNFATERREDTGIGACSLFLGFICSISGIAWAVSLKNRFAVRISGSSGESDGLVSPDVALVTKIVAAINRAIIDRK